MKSYPDKWVLVKITSRENKVVYKILAGFYGGFAGSDHWQMNSGVKKVDEEEHLWIVHGESGSEYICRKDSEGLTRLTQAMLAHWQKQATIEVVPMQEYVKKELDKVL